MKKTYNNAELQIVRLNRKDIIATSDVTIVGSLDELGGTVFDAQAPGYRDFNDWGHVY